MKSRRRGFSLVHVLVIGALLGTAALTFQASFSATYARAVRGRDRARARAVAQAAWERARAALAAGRDPTGVDVTVLDGQATTRVVPAQGGGRRVVIEALVRRRDGEPVRTRLLLTIDARGDVTAREEAGA